VPDFAAVLAEVDKELHAAHHLRAGERVHHAGGQIPQGAAVAIGVQRRDLPALVVDLAQRVLDAVEPAQR
jgi:hypothetical protein